MGIGVQNLSRIRELCERKLLRPGAAIIELGAQQLHCKADEQFLTEFVTHFVSRRSEGWNASPLLKQDAAALADRGFASALFTRCGFEYRALDIFDADGVTLFDLNIHSIPADFKSRFDLTTNFGTTEHLINQYLSMKSLHELTKAGGIIYHHLPMGGYHTHGYFNYNAMLFEHLAQANGYDVLVQRYTADSASTLAPPVMTASGYPDKTWGNVGIEVVFKKSREAPFRMPLETGTSLSVNHAVWGDKAPYAYSSDAITPQSNRVTGFNDQNAQLTAAKRQLVIDETSGWILQKELTRRYVARLKRWLRLP
jgi:hypothetical protein